MIEIIIASVVWALIGLYIGSKSKSDKNLGEDNVVVSKTKKSKLIKYRFDEHILLVMKWLKNPELVSQEELDANRESAWANYRDANYRDDAAAYAAGAGAAGAGADAAYAGAAGAGAAVWVDKYFKYTGEDKQTYIDKLGE
jgi:hypothetical protein